VFAAASNEAELAGFALDDSSGGAADGYRYLAVWKIHSGSAPARLEAALERIGWSRYFEGIDSLAPAVGLDPLLRDMATLRQEVRGAENEEPAGGGGFFSKLARGLGLKTPSEEPRPSAAERFAALALPEPPPQPPPLPIPDPIPIPLPEPLPVPDPVPPPPPPLRAVPAPVPTPVVVEAAPVPVFIIEEPIPFEIPAMVEEEVVSTADIVFESARVSPEFLPPPDEEAPPAGGMDVDAYLARIGYTGSREPTIETLRELHRAHLRSVPFENLDIINGQSIVLDEGAFFEKIVTRRRGGFCYELNGLFAALLRELGFNVTLLSGNVTNREDGTHGPDFDHMLLMVRLEQRWIADVGFGDSFSEPLRIDEVEEQHLPEGRYRIYNNASLRSLLRRNDDMSWSEQYIFTLLPRELADFANMCDYHQMSPASHFTHQRICSRMTADGRVSLTDTHLILSSGGRRRELQLSSPLEYKTMLREYFGIFTGD
jgi:N-hydroxyarylamine O-acetyltransferase